MLTRFELVVEGENAGQESCGKVDRLTLEDNGLFSLLDAQL
jgi:hypothetical protein